MENHPIPQDITGFQFKLIGNLTVKQFAYLVAGIILGLVIFSLPINLLIKIPIAAFFALLGISLAFLPIEGRPMDVMVLNFIKALFRPTQFVYRQKATTPNYTNIAVPKQTSQDQSTASSQEKNHADLKETAFFQSIPFNAPQPPPLTPEKASAPISPLPEKNHAEEISRDLEKKLEEALRDKEGLEKELEKLQQKLEAQKSTPAPINTTTQPDTPPKTPYLPPTSPIQTPHLPAPNIMPPSPPTSLQQTIKTTPSMPKKSGLPPVSEFPNLISGVIKDPRGNPLPNMLVEIKDQDGNPVRAFKTNQLGQFASATSLANGAYKVDIDDPKEQNRFNTTEFSATGEVIMPLEIISVDPREELRRSLFGSVNNSE